jgi:hypothetical protein
MSTTYKSQNRAIESNNIKPVVYKKVFKLHELKEYPPPYSLSFLC